MKRIFTFFILSFSLAFFLTEISGQTFSTEWIKNNGNSSSKVDIAILGDGYKSNEQAKFITDVNAAVNGMFNKAPFNTLSNSYNILAVKVISNESGAAMSPNALIDNYFGSTFGYSGIDRLLVATNTQRITSVINSNYPEADVTIIIVNSSKYGGSGGQYCTFSIHASATELLIHEFGHTFAKLADEYWAGSQYASEKPNMTANNNTSTVKWKQHLNIQGVGIYPHAESPSWYRPHQDCEMRYLDREFCMVCQSEITKITNAVTGGGPSGTAPAIPANLASADITSSSFTAQWNTSPDATSYTVQKWYNNAWTDIGTTANTWLNLSGFTGGSTQYIKVKAENSYGSSEYSNYINVVLTNTSIVAPTTPTGLAATNVTRSSFTAQWNASSGAASYSVQKWNNGWTNAGTTSNISLNLSGFAQRSTQYIRVNASNSAGSSDYSSWISVRIAAPPALENTVESDNYLYPNPATEFVFVNYKDDYAKVELYSLQGTLIKSVTLNGRRDIDISDLPTGIYLVKITTDSDITQLKLIKN